MVKYRPILFFLLGFFFLGFSFYPTVFELQLSTKLKDPAREFILEHNFYWPDYNLYLSKIRQGTNGEWLAKEKYTSEDHKGSLIQEFYVWLGLLGRLFGLDPNGAYQLGRIMLSPLLMLVIILWCLKLFTTNSKTYNLQPTTHNFVWPLLAFIIIYVSGSFPRFWTDEAGLTHVGRYMEWWSNIDSVQRITFIPHILFGQIVSFYLLYQLTFHSPKSFNFRRSPRLLLYIFLGNLVGLVFPPSLMTLLGVLVIMTGIHVFTGLKTNKWKLVRQPADENWSASWRNRLLGYWIIFIIGSLPVLLYFLVTTKMMPWSSLVEFHRTHPMMIPLTDYIFGTGPVFFLGILGAFVSIVYRDKKFQPILLWVTVTFLFAALFSTINEQSPLRFTQTGLFIPLGLLTTYLFQQLWSLTTHNAQPTTEQYIAKTLIALLILFYLTENLFIMTRGLAWQTEWISQRIGATIPPVPYPPQSMYPLRDWMNGIRWLRDNTSPDDVVVAEITAGNHIPAYSGNTVYFGQSNTVDYERKQREVTAFFKGEMGENQAKIFLRNGNIRYVFFSIQEKDVSSGRDLKEFYPFLKPVYTNTIVTIFSAI